jgi:hypothetical protein
MIFLIFINYKNINSYCFEFTNIIKKWKFDIIENKILYEI